MNGRSPCLSPSWSISASAPCMRTGSGQVPDLTSLVSRSVKSSSNRVLKRDHNSITTPQSPCVRQASPPILQATKSPRNTMVWLSESATRGPQQISWPQPQLLTCCVLFSYNQCHAFLIAYPFDEIQFKKCNGVCGFGISECSNCVVARCQFSPWTCRRLAWHARKTARNSHYTPLPSCHTCMSTPASSRHSCRARMSGLPGILLSCHICMS